MSLLTQPVVALFVSISLGYLIGLLRIGPVQIGGTCGTLFVALAIGQLGVTIDGPLKDTAFALFIFALGFIAGPQFFVNIRSGSRFGIFSLIEVGTVLLLLTLTILVLKLDPGTVAGLFAGAATESAVLGTASEAIGRLGLPAAATATLHSNLVSTYAVTYLFGLVGIVVFTSQIAPVLLRINLAEAARKLAETLGADQKDENEEGLPSLVGRAYRAGPLAGLTVGDFERGRGDTIVIERIQRGQQALDAAPDTVIEADDIVLVLGRRSAVVAAQDRLGEEVPPPAGTNVPITTRDIVLGRKEAFGLSIRELRKVAGRSMQRGIFISNIRRMDHAIPVLPGTRLEQGDILTLYGTEAAIDRAAGELGATLPRTDKTDFIMLGLGVVVGLVIGNLSLKLGTLNLTLGTGGGALLSGLVFGWLHMRHPRHGAIPMPAAEFMKDFGLATFIACVGLAAGKDAIRLLMQYGAILPVLGIAMAVTPALISLFVGTRLLKIEAPLLLGAIAGQQCSTPAITALVSQSNSAIPVVGYTVTYAISNVLLPLMGPLVIWLAATLQ